MTNLTVTAITPCYRTEADGTKTYIGECLKLQTVKTCSLGSQRVKNSMTYLFFTPTTEAEVGSVHQLNLTPEGPFDLKVMEKVLEDGTPVSHTRLRLK